MPQTDFGLKEKSFGTFRLLFGKVYHLLIMGYGRFIGRTLGGIIGDSQQIGNCLLGHMAVAVMVSQQFFPVST